MTAVIPKTLIISDNKKIQQTIYENLLPFKFEITKSNNIRQVLSQKQLAEYDLIISTTDSTEELLSFVNLCKIQKNGKLLLISDLEDKVLKKHNFDCCMHTAFEEVDLIMNAHRLLTNFNQKIRLMEMKKKIHSKRIAKKELTPVTSDPFIKSQIKNAAIFAEKGNNIFISGPTGSGKSRFVDFIYNCSPIVDKHYLYADCKNFTEPYINDLLFENAAGGKYYSDYLNEKFQGILFLDNITSMSLETQSMLAARLELLLKESKDIQIISTSNHTKTEALQEFLLLPTLATYICESSLNLTPLTERKEDILILFDHFQNVFNSKYNLQPKTLSRNFKYLLTTYNWPQNIEQLKIVVKKFCFFGEQITEKQFKKMIDSTETGKFDLIPYIATKKPEAYHTPKFLHQNLK